MLRSLSHALLSGIFITGGAEAFLRPAGRPKKVEAAGIPAPEAATAVNAATMVVAGTMLGFNLAPRLAAAALIATLIPTTLVGHAFWKEETEAGRKMQLTQFMKNLGLIGGLLLVLSEKESKG